MKRNTLLTLVGATLLASASITVRADDSTKPVTTTVAEKTGDAKKYPLDTCIVTDEKLGEHGKGYTFVHKGQEIKLCCKDCLKDFKKEPAKYLKKIESAEKK